MDNIKAEVAKKIGDATNILVTVSTNPDVDQLAACLGLTLWLNKLNKHATAVFSGDIPNALEFLQPEATIEKNTDSLRDFIIALDKSKADKLRYKVEDRVVKIFITPYRTSLSSNDLEFSQGDFNVDAIVALGVTKQEDLDSAIVAHGRILHDAVIVTINLNKEGELGSLNWNNTTASSLSELVYELGQMLDSSQIDPQISTALLTGIVSETNRFSNNKTTPNTMSVAAALMNSGANQQLVASKLDESNKQKLTSKPISNLDKNQDDAAQPVSSPAKTDNGTLEIDHPVDEKLDNKNQPAVASEPVVADSADYIADNPPAPPAGANSTTNSNGSKMIFEPPTLGGTLTANSRPDDDIDPITDPLSLPENEQSHIFSGSNNLQSTTPLDNSSETAEATNKLDTLTEQTSEPTPNEPTPEVETTQQAINNQAVPTNEDSASQLGSESPMSPRDNYQAATSLPPLNESVVDSPPVIEEVAEPTTSPANNTQTLEQLEQQVNSPHLANQNIDALRDKLSDALKSVPSDDLKPVEALNAVNVDLDNPSENNIINENSTEFKPENFGLSEEDNSNDDPPEVPPPIVPPNFLPPQPPS